jgi:hypothetical protein
MTADQSRPVPRASAVGEDALDAIRDAFRRGDQWYRVREMILALVRPVEGVTLTPEEILRIVREAEWAQSEMSHDRIITARAFKSEEEREAWAQEHPWLGGPDQYVLRALAARLGASS